METSISPIFSRYSRNLVRKALLSERDGNCSTVSLTIICLRDVRKALLSERDGNLFVTVEEEDDSLTSSGRHFSLKEMETLRRAKVTKLVNFFGQEGTSL